jgi:hypothetical protein
MNRRLFLEMLGAAGVVAQAEPGQTAAGSKSRIFIQQNYLLKGGTQGTRLNDYLSKTYLPALAKVHRGPTLVLNASLAAHLPQVAVLTGYPSIDEVWAVRARLAADKEFEAATDAWESAQELPFENTNSTLLENGDYVPPLSALDPPPKAPRVFEMRTYHAPTWRHMRGLQWRFGTGEMTILARCGAAPILFGTTVIGQDTPNLTWITAFEDETARDKAWAAFSADPDWQKLSEESNKRYGPNPTVRQIRLYRATAYSPIL